jgi:hypothetical protein
VSIVKRTYMKKLSFQVMFETDTFVSSLATNVVARDVARI